MEIEWLKNAATRTDKSLSNMTSSFFSALMWIKEAQDKDSGKWNDYDYTCVSAAQLSVVGSDLVTDNLERAVQYIKSSQYTPGIFSPDTGGGEPTLTSTCLAILGLYSSGQRLNRDELKKSLDFLEGGILKKCVNSQAVYPLSEQHGLKARERRYTAHEEGKHWE